MSKPNHPADKPSANGANLDTRAQTIATVEQLAAEINPGRTNLQLTEHSSIDTDAGLDSLGRTELLRRLESNFQVQLPEQSIFSAETVADLIVALSNATTPSALAPTTTFKISAKAGRAPPSQAATLTDALQWHVENQPEREHILLLDTDGTATTKLRYIDLWERAQRVAGGLRERALEPGQSVALMLPTSADFFYAFAGILLAGGVPVPIYPPARIAQLTEHLQRQAGILDNAEAVLLITVPEAHKIGQVLRSRLPRLRAVCTVEELAMSPAGARVLRRDTDVALMQYTSGSTGLPKGVVLTHANLLANIRAMGVALHIDATDVFVSWLPLYHDMGLIGAWLGTLYHGIPLVLMSPLAFIARPHRWLWAIDQFGGTLSAAPNFAYELCARKVTDAEIDGLDLSTLRFTCNGAEPVNADTVTRFIDRFGAYGLHPKALAPVYGLAENCVGLAFPPPARGVRIDCVDADLFRRRNQACVVDCNADALRIVGCGLPLRGHEVRIVDRGARELPERHIGRLQFRGPSATQGYFRNIEASNRLLQDGWLDSGDYAYLAEGEIFVTGRAKDLIIRAGRNIYPYDLEQAIGDLPGVRSGAVAVFGSIDPSDGNERLTVVAETRERDPNRRSELMRAIEQVCTELVQLPADDVVLAPPRAVLKTSSGKIRRSACRDLYERGKIGQREASWSQLAAFYGTTLLPLLKRGTTATKSWLFAGYSWVLFGLFSIPAWLLVVILPGRRMPHAVVRGVMRLLSWLTLTPLTVRGQQHLVAGQPYVVVANHSSYLDALVLSSALPHGYRFVAKRELARSWFLRKFLDKAGTWFVERFDAKRSAQDASRIIQAVRRGQSLVFFPEGTFTRAPGLRSFRMGAFVSAARADIAVIPVAIRGTRNVLRGDHWFPHRGRIEVEFLPGLRADSGDWQGALDLRDRARQAILAVCREPDLVD